MPQLVSTDSWFPLSLSSVKPSVSTLFYKGNFDLAFFDKTVAVVGSRTMTSYGKQVVAKIIPPLVDAGVTIISGFMYGVDQEAHRICLECGGHTVAVLGWGIDWPVADSDHKLYEVIAGKGLILSEYDGAKRPLLWMFPQRNRIVAGLSQAIIVVEAAKKSGSLITAKYAVDYGKKLFAVPGPITSRSSEGTNDLISTRTAILVTDADTILQSMGWHSGTFRFPKKKSDQAQDAILELLEHEPLTADEIAIKGSWSAEEVGVKLSLLQLQEKVREHDGKYFISP